MSAAGASAGEGASFERLNRASVALLDPLFDEGGAGTPAQLAARLGDAIMHCAQEADAVGLRSLNYLATLLVPYLQREAGGQDWAAARERVEAWVGQVIAFCAGHAPPAEAVQLVLELQSWPGFPPVPDQFVDLIAGRLREDAMRIAAMLEGAAAAAAGPVPAHEDERHGDAAGAEAGAAPTVASDELAMLAEAVDALAGEAVAPLEAIALPPEPPDRDTVADLLDLCHERLGNLAGAMRYVGLAPAAELLEPCRDSLRRWRDAPDTCGRDAPDLLGQLASSLAAFFAAPQAPALGRLQAACDDPRWPVAPAGQGLEGLQALRGLAVVGSRQVSGHRAIEVEDVSLEVPPDADVSVLDNLLRELPALSAEFAMHVERLIAVQPGTVDAGASVGKAAEAREAGEVLAAARRVAHTLKGAANTVGIRGIATLTHRLEDLLQLLADRDDVPDAVVRATLAEASDCLGEMTDAVAGLGDGPADALAVCGALGELIDRRLGAGGPPTGAGPREGSGVPASQTFPPEAAPEAAPDHAARVEEHAGVLAGSPGEARSVSIAAEAFERRSGTAAAPPEAVAGAPSAEGELLRVPAMLLDRVLDLAGEAGILLARVQEQVDQLSEVRQAFRTDSDRLRELAGELERLVDIRGVSLAGRRGRGDFDPLELDDYDELHTVSRRIGEAAADARLMDQQLERQGASLVQTVGQLERVQTDLREAVMQSRMVPVRGIVPRLQRVVRQAARMTGKSAELEVLGEDTDVDARLLQSLVDPIAHLLRNAVDHGIEPAPERERSGKPATGRVTLAFRRDGRRLLVRCSDDGRGLDLEAIRRRAEQAGLLARGAQADPQALARLVLEPGFTTREGATQVSGRGIGLDVVRRAVRELRGDVVLSRSSAGGLQVDLDVPEGMVAIPVVVVRTPSHVLALSIRGVERILPAEGAVRDDAGRLRFVGEDGLLPALRLDELIGLPEGFFAREAEAARLSATRRPAAARPSAGGDVAFLVRRADGARVAVIAPAPGQTRNVAVRPLPSWLPAIPSVEGATVLGDGAVATVLDLPALTGLERPLAASALAERPAPRLPLCLVADDSVSVRRSMELFLADLGFEVASASDGADALALARRRPPALAVIDLEMPRMNGIELCRALRADDRTRAVPVIMITSRSSERHRRLAVDAGVDVFLTKPYSEDELAAEIRRCLVEPAAKV